MSYIRKMIERDNNMRPTVGFRVRFKPSSSWAKHFEEGRHVILEERNNKSFSAFVLPKGFTGKLKKDVKLFDNSIAWIEEEEVEIVDTDLHANMLFIDWYRSVEEDVCPDCGKSIITGTEKCPECGFSWE